MSKNAKPVFGVERRIRPTPLQRFDDDYQYFLAVTQTPERTERHVGVIRRVLELRPGEHVLDAPCGIGRISNRLGAGGVRVTGIDSNSDYVRQARAAAPAGVDYLHADMRALPWTNRFDAAVCWFVSFGYFDDATDKAILRELCRTIRPGGRLLLEHVDLEHYAANLPSSRETVTRIDREGNSMLMRVQFDPVTSRNHVRRVVVREGRESEMTFSVRLFARGELQEWLLECGFGSVEFLSKNGHRELRAHDDRMLVLARK